MEEAMQAVSASYTTAAVSGSAHERASEIKRTIAQFPELIEVIETSATALEDSDSGSKAVNPDMGMGIGMGMGMGEGMGMGM